MTKIYLKVPNINELHYRQQWMKNIKTMSYNSGYKLDLKGYDCDTGTTIKTNEEMIDWFSKWINKEPDKYFAYIYDKESNIPVGEIYFYYEEELNVNSVGILIDSKYRGKGYGYEALLELEKIAFEKYNIKVLSDIIPSDRTNAIKVFKKAGFIYTDLIKKGLKFDKIVESRQLIITKDMYQKNQQL